MIYQIISLLGAILILFAFAAAQMRRMQSESAHSSGGELGGAERARAVADHSATVTSSSITAFDLV
jgi:hypothetical protein